MEEKRLRVVVRVADEAFVMVFPASLNVEAAYKKIESMVLEVKEKSIVVKCLRGKLGVLMKDAMLCDVLENGEEVTVIEKVGVPEQQIQPYRNESGVAQAGPATPAPSQQRGLLLCCC